MSGVPKRINDDGVTHSSSSLANYPHEDSGSYPISTHPAQVHQQPHQHLQSQSHLHSLPHSHSHPPLTAAAAASAYEVESRSVKGSRSEPRDGEGRTPIQLMYRSPSLPTTVSSSYPHLNHTPALLEPGEGANDGRELRVESRENRNDGRDTYCETKREIQGSKSGDMDGKFERIVDDSSGKGDTRSYTRHDGRETNGEAKRDFQGPKSDRDAKCDRIPEERETARWERDRMDQKDRERNKEKNKDHIKREPQSGAEEFGKKSAKPADQEYVAPEQKQNEREGCKKDNRRERDGDYEAKSAEKRSRVSEKEYEVGCLEGKEAIKKEKDAFNYGIQQQNRMLREIGSPPTTNSDHVRSQSQDDEGVQGKSEVSIIVYRVGECMQELIKLWKEYESSQPDKSGDFASSGPTLEVRIPAEDVTATNRQVRNNQLWGTDIYTDDSDLVAVLMHTGYCRLKASAPPTMQELRTTIRVLPSQDYYTSKIRNNIRSRAWGAGIGCSYRVERCYILKKGGGTIELEPSLTHSSTVEPTLAPMSVERSMTTRAAASNALRQQRFVREVTIQYNLCNEPWIKYSIGIVADKGVKKPLFTSARLKKGDVLYLETHSCRYELCFTGEKTMKPIQTSQQHSSQEAMEIDDNNKSHNNLPNDKTNTNNSLIDAFRWSRCKKPLPEKLMRSIGFPLPPDHIEVLEENIDWEDVQWSETGVWIAGKEYRLARLHFLSPN